MILIIIIIVTIVVIMIIIITPTSTPNMIEKLQCRLHVSDYWLPALGLNMFMITDCLCSGRAC